MDKRALRIQFSGYQRRFVAASQGWCCNNCGTLLSAKFEVDHKVRLADGGGNAISNLQALCTSCHASKTSIENRGELKCSMCLTCGNVFSNYFRHFCER